MRMVDLIREFRSDHRIIAVYICLRSIEADSVRLSENLTSLKIYINSQVFEIIGKFFWHGYCSYTK